MASTRLPGKILKPIKGVPILEYLIKRVNNIEEINEYWVATSNNKADDIIEHLFKSQINVFRGDEQAVLGRYYALATQTKANTIIRITADCPFSDPDLIKKAIQLYNSKDVDYLSNVLDRSYPDGLDVEIFSYKALKITHEKCKDISLREHVTPYMKTNYYSTYLSGSFKTFNFKNYVAQISLRDSDNKEKYIGNDENWEKAEKAIIDTAKQQGLETVVEYGEAAFYGPKLDFMVKDALGREWQLGTIQVDYNLPERFELEYTGADNKKHRPVMIHRAPFGSMERFVAVLIEHCGGNFPLWLAPDHFIILPISEKYHDYAEKVSQLLKNYDICGPIDNRAETTGRKIRDAEVSKIPYIIIVGEREENDGTISVRKHGGEDLGSLSVDGLIKIITEEIDN